MLPLSEVLNCNGRHVGRVGQFRQFKLDGHGTSRGHALVRERPSSVRTELPQEDARAIKKRLDRFSQGIKEPARRHSRIATTRASIA